MALKPEWKGYAWILLATVTGSTVYVFSKAALNEVSLFQFGFWWFSMAIGWNLLFTLRSPESRKFRAIHRSTFKVLLIMGLVEMVATGTFYTAIEASANPSIPSFLRNMEYIFITLMGVILLHERFRGPEIAGVVLSITGAFVISYHRGGTLSSYLTGSSGLMLLCTTFYAIRTILAKKFIHTISPTQLAINRAIFLCTLATILLVISGQSIRIPKSALISILIGSFLGPFLTSISQYSALKYIEASRAAIIQSTTALFTVIGVFLYFGKLPMAYQAVGGIITIAGVMLIMAGRRLKAEGSGLKAKKKLFA
ncbi:MAG: DMT family transporter [Bacteroidota bacterium]